ncbi:MAG: hypothetical protein Q9201_004176 [Fulgogasparrea decipioides]
MEALGYRQSSAPAELAPDGPELAPKTVIGSSRLFECVKSRLKSIPSIPSLIIAPPLSTTSEPAESSSTIITPTVVTHRASESSTAPTSVLSTPHIFQVQKFHVSPSMPLDEKVQAIWTREIRQRLDAVFYYNHTGPYVPEFMMVGKRADSLKPTIVITCGDAPTKKRVEKTFRGQGWLQQLLKANHIMFVALVAPISLSSGPPSNDVSTVTLNESYAVQLQPSGVPTSCGLGLLISGNDNCPPGLCTLGGLLRVNGEILGLTAGHPFPQNEHIVRQQAVLKQVVGEPSDEDSSSTSMEPFVFNGDDETDTENDPTASTISLSENAVVPLAHIDGSSHKQHESWGSSTPLTRWNIPQAAILPLSTVRHVSSAEDSFDDHDWALLETLPRAIRSRPNKIAHIDQRHDVLIDGTVSGPASGEVTIAIASIGPQLGYLHSSPATLRMGESALEVQLVVLERLLRMFQPPS